MASAELHNISFEVTTDEFAEAENVAEEFLESLGVNKETAAELMLTSSETEGRIRVNIAKIALKLENKKG